MRYDQGIFKFLVSFSMKKGQNHTSSLELFSGILFFARIRRASNFFESALFASLLSHSLVRYPPKMMKFITAFALFFGASAFSLSRAQSKLSATVSAHGDLKMVSYSMIGSPLIDIDLRITNSLSFTCILGG